MMRKNIGVKSDGTQEEHDSKPGAQEIIRAKEDKGKVDSARHPGDAPLKQAEVMLEISAGGNLRVQQKSDTHDNDVDGNEKKNKERERETEINSLHTRSARQANGPDWNRAGGLWDRDPNCCDKGRTNTCVYSGWGQVRIRGKRMSCRQAQEKGYCQCTKGIFKDSLGCKTRVKNEMKRHCKATCFFDSRGKHWPNCPCPFKHKCK